MYIGIDIKACDHILYIIMYVAVMWSIMLICHTTLSRIVIAQIHAGKVVPTSMPECKTVELPCTAIGEGSSCLCLSKK